jgi:predicted RNA-binding protein with TRAM domain
VIDPVNGFAYFGTNTPPGHVVNVNIAPSSFARVGAITLIAGEDYLGSAVLDSANGFAYFGTNTLPGQVVKVNIASASFARVGKLTFNGGEDSLQSAVLDSANSFAYFGTFTAPGRVVKVNITPASFARVGALTLNGGEDKLTSTVIDLANGFAYFSTFTFPGRVVKIDVAPTRPEMAVLGDGQVIAAGDTSPSLFDRTDFGSVTLSGAITHTFTISNSGTAELTLPSSPPVSISGPAGGDFSVVTQPATPVISNTTTTFQVRFAPTLVGTRAALVAITNNDTNENPYIFSIQGSGSNTTPIANAGPDQSVSIGTKVSLDGGGSSDPDGHTPLTYGWRQSGGPAVSLSSPNAVNPTFTAPDSPTSLTFTLSVTDSFGLADPTPDEVVVTVQAVPNFTQYLPLILKRS